MGKLVGMWESLWRIGDAGGGVRSLMGEWRGCWGSGEASGGVERLLGKWGKPVEVW